jgi:hypothetical protein
VLKAQTLRPARILVVDQSDDQLTKNAFEQADVDDIEKEYLFQKEIITHRCLEQWHRPYSRTTVHLVHR